METVHNVSDDNAPIVDFNIPFKVEILNNDENVTKEVSSHEYFHAFTVDRNKMCKEDSVLTPLDPEEIKILHDGTFFDDYEDEVHGSEQFCLFKNVREH